MGGFRRGVDIGRFVMEGACSYNRLWTAINNYSIEHKIELENECLRELYIELNDIFFVFAENITLYEDTVCFDAIINSQFDVRKHGHGDYDYEVFYQWLRVSCEMVIKSKLTSFYVNNVRIYSKEERKTRNYAATAKFVPVIGRKDFDDEAERLLQKLCPKALIKPMPVPIAEIAESMGLKIINTKKLSCDFSVIGQICFSNGKIKIYDAEKDLYYDEEAERGTIYIDPDTFYLRNLGCVNNTIAHEIFHWERHRIYATVESIVNKIPTIACRCTANANTFNENEDWMEWQANSIAPKILMPRTTTAIKIIELIGKYNYVENTSNSCEVIIQIIDELSEFFIVSKQAAKIRMIELGYSEASEVYNYSKDLSYVTSEVLPDKIFDEYRDNEDFRRLFELNLFCYVQGLYVINSDKYRLLDSNGSYVLTESATENLSNCTLTFSYNIAEIYEFNPAFGVMYRSQRKPRLSHSIFYPEYNQKNIDKALAEVTAFQRQIEAAQDLCEETLTQTIQRYMAHKKWNSSIFQAKTGLNSSLYRKITTIKDKKLELPIIVSICVGLDMPYENSRKLIEKAGFALNALNSEHMTYNMILSGAIPKDIIACNAFIEKVIENNIGFKIRLLGSQDYDANKNMTNS